MPLIGIASLGRDLYSCTTLVQLYSSPSLPQLTCTEYVTCTVVGTCVHYCEVSCLSAYVDVYGSPHCHFEAQYAVLR